MLLNRESTYNNVNPVDENEWKALLLLVMRGYKKKKLQFKTGLDGNRYLKNGYWLPIKIDDLNYVNEHSNIKLEGIKIFDEDCGDKYWYDITPLRNKRITIT